MDRIVIPVGVDRSEDDVLELTDLLERQFKGRVRTHSAIVIETDVPEVAALIRAMEGAVEEGKEGQVSDLPVRKKKKPAECVDCGKAVTKAGNRCRSCAMKLRRQEEAG